MSVSRCVCDHSLSDYRLCFTICLPVCITISPDLDGYRAQNNNEKLTPQDPQQVPKPKYEATAPRRAAALRLFCVGYPCNLDDGRRSPFHLVGF